MAAVGRHAAAGGDRAGAGLRSEAAAHGRAVRRARRDDPRADEPRADEHLAPDRDDDRVRHPLDPRGGLPVDPGRGHVRPARPDRAGRRHRPAPAADRSRRASRSATSSSSRPSARRAASRDGRRGPPTRRRRAARAPTGCRDDGSPMRRALPSATGPRRRRPWSCCAGSSCSRLDVQSVPHPAPERHRRQHVDEWPTLSQGVALHGHRGGRRPRHRLALGTLAGLATARWATARELLLPVAIGASAIPIIAFAPITQQLVRPGEPPAADDDRGPDGLLPGDGQHRSAA